MTQTHKKLYIPGPVEVAPEVLEAMSGPMIGHRGAAFTELYRKVQPKLQKLLNTQQPVFLVTASATGMMEGAIRNCTDKRALNGMCGAFSDRWHKITTDNGKEADPLQVEWGRAIRPEMVDEALSTGKYDAFTLVFNETSTGVMNPLEEIADVMKKYPDVLFLVDAVSAMAGTPIDFDRLGIDVCLAGVQKAFAMPPGLTVAAVSEKALKKAETVKGRGHYFDLLSMKKNHDKGQTTSTPSISHIYALDCQLDRFLAEGLEARWERHRKMAETARTWARERFALFAEEGYESLTLTCVANTKEVPFDQVKKIFAEKHNMTLDGGYGKIKGKTFRIPHMGEMQPAELETLLNLLDEEIGTLQSAKTA